MDLTLQVTEAFAGTIILGFFLILIGMKIIEKIGIWEVQRMFHRPPAKRREKKGEKDAGPPAVGKE